MYWTIPSLGVVAVTLIALNDASEIMSATGAAGVLIILGSSNPVFSAGTKSIKALSA